MAGISRGATEISKVSVGSVEVQKISVGSTLVWQAVVLTAAGMSKNGVQTLGNTNRQRVRGWTARSGYAGTVIDDDRIRIVGNGEVNVFVQFNFDSSSASTVQSRWLVHNGVDVVSQSAQSTRDAVLTKRLTVADGDYLWLDAQVSSTSFSYDDIAPTTYITVTPV